MSKYNLTIEQGATLTLSFAYKDESGNAVNLTGYTARSEVRTSYAAPTALIRMTTENGMLEMDGANGTINLSISAANTANLPSTNTAVWDLEIVSGNVVTRLVEGTVRISPEVTK